MLPGQAASRKSGNCENLDPARMLACKLALDSGLFTPWEHWSDLRWRPDQLDHKKKVALSRKKTRVSRRTLDLDLVRNPSKNCLIMWSKHWPSLGQYESDAMRELVWFLSGSAKMRTSTTDWTQGSVESKAPNHKTNAKKAERRLSKMIWNCQTYSFG